MEKIWYGKSNRAREEALKLIEEIKEKIEEDSKRKKIYTDDNDNPEIEVWKWVLVVAWW
jgi:hypothetical protein